MFVSSNDTEILSTARKLNCETVVRPEKISGKKTSMNVVIKHFIDYLEKKKFTLNVLFCYNPRPHLEKKNW